MISSEVTESGVKLTMEPSAGGDSTTMEADVVLVATGRRPYTANLGCDDLGIVMDKMGRIEVDSHFRTAVPSIYAIGDCIAGPMLAHKAEEEGIACVESIAGFAGHVNYDAIPGVVYTHPEVAEVSHVNSSVSKNIRNTINSNKWYIVLTEQKNKSSSNCHCDGLNLLHQSGGQD